MRWVQILDSRSDSFGKIPLKMAESLVAVLNRATIQEPIERAVLLMDLFARVASSDLQELLESFLISWDPAFYDTENTIEGEQFTLREYEELAGYCLRAVQVEEFVATNPKPSELAAFVARWLLERPATDHAKSGVMMVAGLLDHGERFLPYTKIDLSFPTEAAPLVERETKVAKLTSRCFQIVQDPRLDDDERRGALLLKTLKEAGDEACWYVLSSAFESYLNESKIVRGVRRSSRL